MKIVPSPLAGAVVIEPDVFGDERGFFLESWNAAVFADSGLPTEFKQDNHSHSMRGVLRGLHFQQPGPQGKLVRVTAGAVFDVIVDLRRSSSTCGQWYGIELSAENKRILWVPEGFAHGFLTLKDHTDFLYRCTAFYAPEHEHVLAWNDREIGIDWPLNGANPILSSRDAAGSSFADIAGFA